MKNRFVICIPVYENKNTILSVIESCLQLYDLPVLVVDDGSKETVESLYLQKNGTLNNKLSFVRHSKNLGKGVALQSGFQEALRRGYTHLVAIDGDGQHRPSDIANLISTSQAHPWSLIVGDRDMNTVHVPSSSVFGKKFSNFWVHYQTNLGVADSQSGFRIYPLFFIQNMKFFCKKYDFEIEILIRLIWHGVKIQNVPISVQYFPAGERVSHFHKWKDNFRISTLNTVLTICSLFREQTSPFKSSLALALGVFVGTIPIFGFHTLFAAIFAFLFRLNFVYLWVGTNVSIPPLVPFLILASNSIGKKIISGSENSVSNFGIHWILGSIVLGLVLSGFVFCIHYFAKIRLLKKPKSAAWTGQNQNRPGIMIVQFVLNKLGIQTAYFMLYFIVFYYYLFSFRTRKALNEYWKIVSPEVGFFGRQRNMYLQILVFAQALVDRSLQKGSDKLRFEYEVDEAIKMFMERMDQPSNGIITVSTHFGGWELATAFFADIKNQKKILTVKHGVAGQFEHQSSLADQSSESTYFNLESHSILKIKSFLSAGQVVALMGDRPVTESCELVPFFNKLALFDTTPFRTAYACKSEVYFVFVIKLSLFKYKLYLHKVNTQQNLGKEHFVEYSLREYVQHLEETIKIKPEQWFNFFPFWSQKK